MSPVSSNEMLRQPVECVITIDGEEIQVLYPYLLEVTVSMNREGATMGVIKFDSLRDESGNWLVQDFGGSQPLLRPWRKVVIRAVFGRHQEEVMRGYVREVNPDYPQDMSAASVTVIVQDESIMLDREYIQRNWVSSDESSLSDGDIVNMIAGEYQFDTDVQAGLVNTSLASNGTYIQLLRDRAEANGYEFYIREGTIHFHPPALDTEPQASLLIYAGQASNCIKFSSRFDGHKPDEVSMKRAAVTGSGVEETRVSSNLTLLGRQAATSDNMGLPAFNWQLESANGADNLEASARLQAKANENSWKIVAEGELDGALYGHVLLNFKLVHVDGTGETGDGLYYVDRVEHKFTRESYRQSFRLLRNAYGNQGMATSNNPLSNVIGGVF